jgi:uncharacterized protein
VKLVVREAESGALQDHLRGEPTSLVAGDLLEIEVVRAARASRPDALAAIDALLESVTLVSLSSSIRALARSLEPAALRTLDAIHLATAIEVGARSMLVYDRRLGAAAASYGVRAVSPGT